MKHFIVLVCLLPGLFFRPAQAGEESQLEMQPARVSDHVWYVRGKPGTATENEGFISNAGFIVTGDGVVVFDALGTPVLAQMLLARIRDITEEPVKMVIVSHYHADHIYGLQVFKEAGAKILAPAGAQEYLNSVAAEELLQERRINLSPWVNDQTRLVAPDRYLKENEKFRLGDVDFTLTMLGSAHSEGDLTLYVEPDRVLFSGDVIFDGRIPWLGDADTRNWLETLRMIEKSHPAEIIPGHGSLSSNPGQLVKLTSDYLAFLRQKMQQAVDNWQPFDEAYDNIDWGDWEYLPAFFEANRKNAYQIYLSLEQESLKAEEK